MFKPSNLKNLQLLNDSENKSKNKTKLSEWANSVTNYTWSNHFIPKDSNIGSYIVEEALKIIGQKDDIELA